MGQRQTASGCRCMYDNGTSEKDGGQAIVRCHLSGQQKDSDNRVFHSLGTLLVRSKQTQPATYLGLDDEQCTCCSSFFPLALSSGCIPQHIGVARVCPGGSQCRCKGMRNWACVFREGHRASASWAEICDLIAMSSSLRKLF